MENFELIIAYAGYIIATVGTPGPNNIMLTSSGANFGIRASMPHMLGIALGFALMLIIMGLGLSEIFEIYPILYDILKYVSVGFLLFLAYKIATSKQVSFDEKEKGKPLTFIQAAAFQWVNPKAWAMNITAISLFNYTAAGAVGLPLWLMAIVSIMFGFPLIFCWCLFGVQIGKLLKSEQAFKWFNYFMAALLVLTIVTLFI